MYLITNNDYLVVETTPTLRESAYYVMQSLNVNETTVEQDCTGLIYVNRMLIAAPTTYHTASHGKWVISEDNLLLLSQAIAVACSKIISMSAILEPSLLAQVNSIMFCSNKTKAYITLKLLLNVAPSVVREQCPLE